MVSIGSQEGGNFQNQSFHEQIEYLERITTSLHESVMKVRMVPIESVVNKFPRMIRDLSRRLNKKMELCMTGEDTELDRTVVDQIGDPLRICFVTLLTMVLRVQKFVRNAVSQKQEPLI